MCTFPSGTSCIHLLLMRSSVWMSLDDKPMLWWPAPCVDWRTIYWILHRQRTTNIPDCVALIMHRLKLINFVLCWYTERYCFATVVAVCTVMVFFLNHIANPYWLGQDICFCFIAKHEPFKNHIDLSKPNQPGRWLREGGKRVWEDSIAAWTS